MDKIGKIIQRLRKNKKWTQKELADKFSQKKDVTVISRWERDIVQPSANARNELSVILKVPVKTFYANNRQTSLS